MKRLLIIRLSALGDVLHTLPVLAAVKHECPEFEVDWLVEEGAAPLLEGHPMIGRVFVVPRRKFKQDRIGTLRVEFRQLARELRQRHYSVSIDFQGLTKSAIWGRVAGAGQRIGFRGEDARELSSWFYNRRILPEKSDVHVIQKNMALLRALDIRTDRVEFPVALPQAARTRALSIWQFEESVTASGQLNPRIVMNPGAGWVTKQWPAAQFGQLARRLVDEFSARVAIAWGPGEEKLVEQMMEASGSGRGWVPSANAEVEEMPGVYPLPPTTFVELGGVLERADLMIAGDTGPSHFAAALGIPIISIFGASDPLRNGPWDTTGRLRIIQSDTPECIPCWKTRCTWKDPLACLERIGVEQVLAACRELLA